MRKIFPIILMCLLAAIAIPQNPPMAKTGRMPDGRYMLTTGWQIAPAGIEVPLPKDTMPMNLVMHPDGKNLFVLNSGYLPPSVLIMNTANPKDALRVGLDQSDAWLGLALNKAGDRFYVPEGNIGTVQEFSYAGGNVKPLRSFKLFDLLDPSKKGKARLSKDDYLGDATVSADGKFLFVANMQHGFIHAIDLAGGDVSRKWPVGKHPYKLLATAGKLYVSNWGDESITILNPATGAQAINFKTGAHPTDMLLRDGKLYVACANTNSVYIHEADTGIVRERVNIALYPKSPAGSTPNALALSPDGKRLFVANADNNAVAVGDLPEAGQAVPSRVAGFLPTGGDTTGVACSADAWRLYLATGKGNRSYPNSPDQLPPPGGPADKEGSKRPGYVGVLQKGSISIVDMPQGEQLDVYTRRVLANSPYSDALLDKAQGKSVVIPSQRSDTSPVKHVIYIIRENRTYDQIFGDVKEANGDPRLTVFGEAITPNAHKLAKEFTLLDNFYVNADVSADGHAWSMGAIASDFTNKLWPSGYGGRRTHYDSEGDDETGTPGGGWLFHAASRANVSFRTYGEWCHNPASGEGPVTPNDKALEGRFAPNYRAWDLTYPDQKRVDSWLAEFREYEKNGNLPQLEVVRMGNDHTNGTRPGGATPRSLVADNDYALGRLIEALSNSRYWRDTAVFVLEDDAQSGPDHVDSHRSPGFVISSWTRRGVVDSTMYSTVSMLRTMGLILGMSPMSQYDAGASPMHTVFADKPDLRPYTAAKPTFDITEKNPGNAPMAKESMALDFSEADRIDDALMNRIIWAAMKGNEPMPAPVRSLFPAMFVLKGK